MMIKKCLGLLLAGAVFGSGTLASAGDWSLFSPSGRLSTQPVALQPTPEPMYVGPGGPVAPAPGSVVPYGPAEAAPLYHNVEYEDLDNIHPCAVTRIVMVPDPCADPCAACGPQCVAVRICVPPCACERVKRSRDGRKIKYDYGKYEVEIKVKRNYVKVDYDD